ncbi:MAG: PAS domain-containing sensor histidine kinase, partial [Flavobacterium sp.]
MVIQGSNEGLWDVDLNTNQIFWSKRLYDMLGIEFSNKPITLEIFSSFVHSDEVEEVNNLINQSIANDTPFETEFRMRHASGEYINMYSRGKTYYDANKKPTHFAGLIADITKQKNEQEKLKVLSRELEDSNKELKSFSYIASHDLQGPLRTISSYANLLTRKYTDVLDEQAKK